MKIAIFGTGGVGGYFGGLLANAGHNVTFIARGVHLAAIRKDGLQVKSVNGDFHVLPAQATDNPAEVGIVDAIIVCVKEYHLTDAAEKILPMVGKETMVVPLLNGVNAHEILAESVGIEKVVGGLCAVIAYIESPGVIRQESKLRRVVIGELNRIRSERVEWLVKAWAALGVEAIHAPDIHVALWTKFMLIVGFASMGSLTRLPIGAWRDVPETREIFIASLKEIEAVGRACGVALPEGAVNNAIEFVDAFEPGATASMQRDVSSGNLFELEAFNGTVVRSGRKLGVPTPVHDHIYALLKPALIQAANSQA